MKEEEEVGREGARVGGRSLRPVYRSPALLTSSHIDCRWREGKGGKIGHINEEMSREYTSKYRSRGRYYAWRYDEMEGRRGMMKRSTFACCHDYVYVR